ncbi:hypothetical protein HDV05_001962 [Chytridiales sp. JEL 0842]|nr:hypothetical protein HDV05_001962 [Chytridiales sp. JEL 0842]
MKRFTVASLLANSPESQPPQGASSTTSNLGYAHPPQSTNFQLQQHQDSQDDFVLGGDSQAISFSQERLMVDDADDYGVTSLPTIMSTLLPTSYTSTNDMTKFSTSNVHNAKETSMPSTKKKGLLEQDDDDDTDIEDDSTQLYQNGNSTMQISQKRSLPPSHQLLSSHATTFNQENILPPTPTSSFPVEMFRKNLEGDKSSTQPEAAQDNNLDWRSITDFEDSNKMVDESPSILEGRVSVFADNTTVAQLTQDTSCSTKQGSQSMKSALLKEAILEYTVRPKIGSAASTKSNAQNASKNPSLPTATSTDNNVTKPFQEMANQGLIISQALTALEPSLRPMFKTLSSHIEQSKLVQKQLLESVSFSSKIPEILQQAVTVAVSAVNNQVGHGLHEIIKSEINQQIKQSVDEAMTTVRNDMAATISQYAQTTSQYVLNGFGTTLSPWISNLIQETDQKLLQHSIRVKQEMEGIKLLLATNQSNMSTIVSATKGCFDCLKTVADSQTKSLVMHEMSMNELKAKVEGLSALTTDLMKTKVEVEPKVIYVREPEKERVDAGVQCQSETLTQTFANSVVVAPLTHLEETAAVTSSANIEVAKPPAPIIVSTETSGSFVDMANTHEDQPAAPKRTPEAAVLQYAHEKNHLVSEITPVVPKNDTPTEKENTPPTSNPAAHPAPKSTPQAVLETTKIPTSSLVDLTLSDEPELELEVDSDNFHEEDQHIPNMDTLFSESWSTDVNRIEMASINANGRKSNNSLSIALSSIPPSTNSTPKRLSIRSLKDKPIEENFVAPTLEVKQELVALLGPAPLPMGRRQSDTNGTATKRKYQGGGGRKAKKSK